VAVCTTNEKVKCYLGPASIALAGRDEVGLKFDGRSRPSMTETELQGIDARVSRRTFD
jgi:hypothetical protein